MICLASAYHAYGFTDHIDKIFLNFYPVKCPFFFISLGP